MVTTRRRPAASAAPAEAAPARSTSAPTDEDLARPDDVVEVARILGAWGVKGAVRVKPLSADPQALFSSKRWWLEPSDRPAARVPGSAVARIPRLLRVIQAREQGETIVATAQRLEDRDQAQALAGVRVYVSRASFPTPQEGEFYWVDLIGLTVRNRQGQVLGQVDHLIETGPHAVLVVLPPDPVHESLMIPFVAAYVDRVDREAGVIAVDWDPS